TGISRRTILRAAGALGLELTLGFPGELNAAPRGHRKPGSRPKPHRAEGTDQLPQLEHLIVLMMENHSFDNYLGMLGRGDGFHRRHGQPIATNDDDAGNPVTAFHMPST